MLAHGRRGARYLANNAGRGAARLARISARARPVRVGLPPANPSRGVVMTLCMTSRIPKCRGPNTLAILSQFLRGCIWIVRMLPTIGGSDPRGRTRTKYSQARDGATDGITVGAWLLRAQGRLKRGGDGDGAAPPPAEPDFLGRVAEPRTHSPSGRRLGSWAGLGIQIHYAILKERGVQHCQPVLFVWDFSWRSPSRVMLRSRRIIPRLTAYTRSTNSSQGSGSKRCRVISRNPASRLCFEFIRTQDMSPFPTLIRSTNTLPS